MLRELIDMALLEDFLLGAARASGWRLGVYDPLGALITVSPPANAFALLSDWSLEQLPRPLEMSPLRAPEPPANVAFVEHRQVWQVVAPVYAGESLAGYLSVGDLRAAGAACPSLPTIGDVHVDADQWQRSWEALPVLERSGDARAVAEARWGSRMLASWCRHELQLQTAAEEIALVADISGLLSGTRDLQTLLDQIVAETARVMKCRYASMRLFDSRTDELTVAAVHNLSPQYVSKGVIRRSENPIDDQALRGQVVYVEDAQSDPRIRFPAEARALQIVSGLTAGMTHHGRPIGVLRIYSDRRRRFRPAQRQLLQAVAAQAAIAIVNARLLDERLRSAAMERELALAGDVQARMVRTVLPAHRCVETAMIFEPSSHVGGDFCDVLTLPDGRLLAAVGDVTGHGAPASLLMASVRGALRVCAEYSSDLREIARRLNAHAYRETATSEFVTLVLAVLDGDGRALTYCSAGHEPPLLLRNGEIVALADGGLPLGLEPEQEYETTTVELAAGDVLLLYTDGAVEAMDFAQETYGRERLWQSLREHQGLAAGALARNLRWDIRRFVGLAEQSDDLTMVVLRVPKSASTATA